MKHPLAPSILCTARPFFGGFLAVLLGLTICESVWAQEDAAGEAWGRRDLAAAERLYSQRLAADSGDAEALYRLGMILAWTQRYQEGVILLDQLVQVSPDNVDAQVDRARVIAWGGDLSSSRRALDSLMERSPRHLGLLELRAQVASWDGQVDEARANYERLLEVAPNPSAARRSARLGLAQALAWSRKLDSSRTIYQSIMSDDSTDLQALRGLARSTAWSGDLIDAEDMWQRAIELDPTEGESIAGLSQTLRWQGRAAEAFELMVQAPGAEPSDENVMQDERRELHSVLGPRARAAITRENDSDGNDMTTFQLRTGWHPHPRLAVGFDGYFRQTEFRIGVPDRSAEGATVSLTGYLVPGWNITGAVGASGSNGITGRTFFNGFASVSTPRRYPVNGAVTYRRGSVDATALLIEKGVSIAELTAVASTSPSRGWALIAEISRATLSGTQDNNRTLGRFSVTREIANGWGVGGRFRAFGYEKDLTDGYFDPNFYLLVETPVSWHHDFEAWRLVAEAAPGLQQIGSDGSLDGVIGLDGRVTYLVAPGRDVGFKVVYSRSGASTFATGDTDYRYVAVGLIATWVF